MRSGIVKYTKAVAVGTWFVVAIVGLFSLHGSPRPDLDRSNLTDPAALYETHCASCHGLDGRAKTAKGKRSGATDLTSEWDRDEARGIRIITKGKGEMPSFKGKLTSQEIREVFGHIIKFGR